MVAIRKELKCGCVQLLFPTTIRYVKVCKKHEVNVADGTTTDDGIPPNNKLLGILPNEL